MSVSEMVTNAYMSIPLQERMKKFSLYLTSLYAENAVSSSANNATSINAIRDQTRRDAIVYVKGVLPLCTQVLRCIQEFFEYFESLALYEWKECLPDFLEKVTGYQQCFTEIVRMHEEMMAPLKKRQDEAKMLISENKVLDEKLMKKKAILEGVATISHGMSYLSLIVPKYGTVAAPLLEKGANVVLAHAEADGQQVNMNEAAIRIVSDVLIPALYTFLDGLHDFTGFFYTTKEELTFLQSRVQKAVENPKPLYYVLIKHKATEFKRKGCKECYAMIPGVRTELRRIKEEQGDLLYVGKWRSKQQEEIKRKYSQMLTGQLKKLLEAL